jgi:chaperonin GroEL (HSP60 family)
VPGGGIFYLFLADEIRNWSYLNLIGEEVFAGQIISKGLKKPFEELFENNSMSPYQILQQIEMLGYPYAYNLIEKKISESLDTGLLDASKSVRASLWNSISTVSLLITSQ